MANVIPPSRLLQGQQSMWSQKNRSSRALCCIDSSEDSFFISAGGSGSNLFTGAIFSSMNSTFGMPITTAETGGESE